MANHFVARGGIHASGSSAVTGSLTVTGAVSAPAFTGSLFGTSSWAATATTAATASSFSGYINFPAGLDVSGSLLVTGSVQITGSISVSRGFSGSLFGTSSWSNNALTASYALNGGGTGAVFPYTGSAIVSGSLMITGSIIVATGTIIGTSSYGITSPNILLGTGGQGKLYNSGTDILIEASGNLNLISSNGNTPLRLFSSASSGVGTIAPFNINVLSSTRAYAGFFTDWDTTYRSRGSTAGIFEFSNGGFLLAGGTGLTPLSTFVPTTLLVVSASGVVSASVMAASSFTASNGVYIDRVDTAGIASANYLTMRAAYGADAALSHSIIWRDASAVTGKIDTRFNGSTVDMFLGSLYNSGYNSVDIITIKGTGNVGIGSNSPTARLHVQGNLSASSYTSSIVGNVGFLGTSSWASNANAAISSSFSTRTISGSYALNALTASYALNGGSSGASFPYTGSAIISGSLSVTGSTTVLGAFQATTKSFRIDHQLLLGKKLVYGVLEGPEHGVYVRGRLTNQHIIVLPEEWKWLVDPTSITVQLTAIGEKQQLYVESIGDNKIVIGHDAIFTNNVNCFYYVQATRCDVAPLNIID